MNRASSDGLGLDGVTNAVTEVGYEHHEIHEGRHFYISGYETKNTAGVIEFIITTPDTTRWSHMTFAVVGTQNTKVEVYRGPTGVTGGASVTPINNNENSSKVSGNTVIKDPTSITADGLLRDSYSVGSSSPTPVSPGNIGLAERDNELILKQNTAYLFRITSGGDGNIISYKGKWYEHTNKE